MKPDIESLNEKLISIIFVVMFLIVGGVYGYSIALYETADQISSAPAVRASKRVLGTAASPYYVNPFEVVDAKEVKFPIDQLRGCRNWEECNSYCEEEVNYPACIAWSKSLK